MQRDTRFDSDADANVIRLPSAEEPGHGPAHIVIPDAHLLFTAHFQKAGSDLILTGEDGKKVLVTDYFRSANPPALQSPQGATLSAELVQHLTVPENPAQYAQAGAPAGAKVIGRVEKVTGTATVQHANGLVVELKVGDLIVQGDVVQTSDGSSIGIGMLDGTAFSMESNARMVLTDMVYDPNGSSNSAFINFVQGSITFVAGKVAKTGDMKIATPVATMGIRGTTVNSKHELVDGTTTITLLRDQDGSSGVVSVLDNNNLSNVIYTITETNNKLVIRPIGGGQVSAQAIGLTPSEISLNAGLAQLVYDVSNSINANPLTIDLQPRTAPIPRLDSPNPLLNPPNNLFNNQDLQHNVVLSEFVSATVTAKGPDDSLIKIPLDFVVTTVADQTSGLTAVSVKAAPAIEAGAAGPGNPISQTTIVPADVGQTPFFDVATMIASGLWIDNGNGTISSTNGAFGTATLDPTTGNVTYVLDNTKADDLAQGENVTDTFNVLVKDNAGGAVTVPVGFDINGANDAPKVSAPVATEASQNAPAYAVDLLANATDVDHGAVLHVANLTGELPAGITLDADGHTLHIDPSVYASLAEGQQAVLHLTYDVVDEHGALVAQTATITIDGVNDAPTVSAPVSSESSQNAAAYTVDLLTNASDVDQGAVLHVANLTDELPAGVTLDPDGHTLHIDPSVFASLAEGQNAVFDLSYNVVDEHGASVEQTATITVDGVNDAPTVSEPVSAETTQNAAAYTIDLLANASDIDQGAALHVENLTDELPAGVTLDPDGHTLHVDPSVYASLPAGQQAVFNLTYTVVDEYGAEIAQTATITIDGLNDPATIDGIATGDVTEGGEAPGSTSGQLTVHDVDTGEATFQAVPPETLVGNFGTFTFDPSTGDWTYTVDPDKAVSLNDGAVVDDTLTVKSIDGTAVAVIDVAITGTNEAAVLSSDVRNLTETNSAEDISTSGQLTVSDPDTGEDHFQAQDGTEGNYGTFSIGADGAWSYVASSAHDEFVDGQTYTDVFDVQSADGTHTSVTINILGTNDSAQVFGDTSGTVIEAGGVGNASPGTPSVTGALFAADVDNTPNLFQPASGAGANNYGSFVVTAAGVWLYTLDNGNAAVQALNSGQHLTDTFTVLTADGTAQVVTVIIDGSNDTAAIAGETTGTVVEAGGVNNGIPGTPTAIGTLTDTDVDNPQDLFQAVSTATASDNHYGTFTVTAEGAWTYVLDNSNAAVQALNNGDLVTDTFTVHAADGTAQVVTVTINGSNDAASVFGVDYGWVTEAGGVNNANPGVPAVSGQLFDTDADNTRNTFQPVSTPTATASGYGSFTITAAGVWTYALDNSNPAVQALNTINLGEDTFTVFTADGTAHVVTVDIYGANDDAVISGQSSGTVTEAGGAANAIPGTPTATGQLFSADVDDPPTFQSAFGSTNYGTYTIAAEGLWTYTLNNNNSAVQALNVGDHLTDTFTVLTAGGTAQTVTVTIDGSNDAAIVSGTSNGTVVEAGGINNGSPGTPTASGTLTDTDVDNPANTFQAASGSGASGYGSYTVTAVGAWVYTLNNSNATVQALNVGQHLTDTFTVLTADGTAQVVSVTINGSNDAAVISGTSSGTVVEAGGINNGSPGTPTASGTLTDTDVDNPANTFQAASGSGASGYGSYTVTAVGAWVYTLNNSNATVQALNVGQHLTDTFTVLTADGTAQVVSVTINGSNDAAVISGTSSGTVVEAGGVGNAIAGTPTASGTLTDTDVDNPANTFQAASGSGASGYGSYAVTAAGLWVYTLNNSNATVQALNVGQHLTDTFTVLTADGTAQVVTVTINGSNDAATIAGTSSGTVVEAGGVNNGSPGTPTASGTLTDTDVDNPANTFQAASGSGASGYGSYAVTAAGLWIYTLNNANAAVQALNNGQHLTDTFTVLTADGTAQVVSVTINGSNDTAVISGTSSGTVVEAGGVGNAIAGTPTANGTLTDTDVDNPANTFQAASGSGASGYGSYTVTSGGAWVYTLDDANTAVQALNSGQHLTDTFTVLTADGTAQVVTVTINGANDAPVAAADHFSTNEDKALSIVAASGVLANDTDVDTAHASLKAILDAGPAHGTLTFNQNGSFTYTPELNFSGTDTFTYHANDGSLSSAPVTVSVDVAAVNDKPIVLAPSELDYWTASATGNVTVINHISFLDADAGSDSVTVTLSFANGNVLTAADVSGDGVGIAGSGSNAVILTGSIDDINAYIAGNHVLFNPAGNSFPIADQTLTVSINDNGHNGAGGSQTASAQVLLHSLSSTGGSTITFGNGDDFLDLHGVNMSGITSIHMGGGSNTIITSENNLSVVTYDSDDTGGPDTGTLVFTPEQLVQILSDTAAGGFESKLQSYLDGDPGSAQFADTLDLSASSWKAIVSGLETAWVALATDDDYTVYTAIGDDLPNLRTNQTGTNSDDTLVATAGHANLSGGNGNDILVAASVGSALDGGAGSDLLLGSSSNDTLTGGAGDDIIFGGMGNDTFKFAPNFGQDTVLDFHPGEDVIEIDHTIFADFSDLIAHATDHGHDVVIAANASNTITLKDLVTSVLHASDFHFV